MPIRTGLSRTNFFRCLVAPLYVDDVVMRLIKLRLGEIRQQVLVPPMTIHDHYFLATVSRHFVRRFLKEMQLQLGAIGNRTRFVLGLENLPRIVLRKNYGVLFLSR